MNRSLRAVMVGTFTLRFSTGLTGALLIYYLADLPKHGGESVDQNPLIISALTAAFFITELCLSPLFGLLSDRIGYHRVMQMGPVFGLVAAIITGLTTNLWLLGGTRLLEGASTAASVPSILGFIAWATTADQALRGRTSSLFEGATIAGLGAGFAAAGPLYVWFGPVAFFLNAGVYVVSLLIYRYGVDAPDEPIGPSHHPAYGRHGYRRLLRQSHVWLLAPTWIAINAALGLYTGQTLFQLIREPDPRFPDQALVGALSPFMVTAGFLVAGVVFFAGLFYWGTRFKDMRRTTIIFYGIGGGALVVCFALLLNHAGGLADPAKVPLLIGLGIGLFVLAGATPAALGLLADISEAFPDDRGAIMGLYSVFLAIGQIVGSFIGGLAAKGWALDGILVATFVLMGVALIPLARLRRYESRFDAPIGGAVKVEVLES